MIPQVPETLKAALSAIQDPEFLTTKKYREQQWRAERKGVDPQILLFERLLVRRLHNIGVPMFASEAMRSQERQAEVYRQGHSKIKSSGPHTVGCAVDVIHSLNGWEIPEKSWALIGHVGKEICLREGLRIRWGGDWKFYDPAHWEREDWKTRLPA